MDLCQLDDLNKYCKLKVVTHKQKIQIMTQIMKGVKYLHDNDIIHRDIKPGNILVASDNPMSLQITDFDVSKFLEDNSETSAMTSNVGTIAFKAPEFYQRQPGGKLHYLRSVDVFSCGLTFLALLQANKGAELLIPH